MTEKRKFVPVPAGQYLVAARKMTEGPLVSGNGRGITAEFEVLEGDNAKDRMWHLFITTHTKPIAAEIGLKDLNKYLLAIGEAGGLDALGSDYTQLENYLNKALTVNAVIEEGTERPANKGGGFYSDKNKVKSFSAR